MDSKAPMRAMAEAARDHGMAMVCFTDHIDMDDDKTGLVRPNYEAVWPKVLAAMAELRADPPKGIEVRQGMELGEPAHDIETARKAAADPELDFVLGSLHNLRGMEDFYWINYTGEDECRELNHRYLAELIEMTELDFFDVMSHVGYTARYMARKGFRTRLTADLYRDELAELFTRLIRQGRGIEVNVSGLRCGETTYPEITGLRLYRDLGGEIITLGSDAHTTKDAGIGIKEAGELLRSLGYRYYTEFKRRRPEFIKLQ